MDELDRILQGMADRPVPEESLRRVMAGLGALPPQRRPWWQAEFVVDWPRAAALATAMTVGVVIGLSGRPPVDLSSRVFDATPSLGFEK